MKIYTANYDANRPALKQINIPNFSVAKIGIEVVKNGEKLELDESNVVMKSGDTTISADGVYDGFVTIPVSTRDCGNDTMYKVEIDKGLDWETVLSGSNKLPIPFNGPLYSGEIPAGTVLNARKLYEQTGCAVIQIMKNNTLVAQYWHLATATEFFWYKGQDKFGEDFKVEDEGCILQSDYNFEPFQTISLPVTVGEAYSDSFKLVINSVKSSVIDAAEATEIPVATAETLGGVKVGDGLTIDDDGTLKTTGGYVEEEILIDMSKMETEGPTYYLTNLQPGKSYRIIADETTAPASYEWQLNIEPDVTAGWKLGDKCRIYFSPDDKYSDSVFQYMTFSSTLGSITYWYGNKCFKYGQCSQWRANDGFYFELTYGTIENPYNNELIWTITGGSQGGYYQE